MKEFIDFLERNNAWKNFKREFKKHGKNPILYLKECKEEENLELTTAFPWAGTNQGFIYWARLDARWRQKNNELKNLLSSDD